MLRGTAEAAIQSSSHLFYFVGGSAFPGGHDPSSTPKLSTHSSAHLKKYKHQCLSSNEVNIKGKDCDMPVASRPGTSIMSCSTVHIYIYFLTLQIYVYRENIFDPIELVHYCSFFFSVHFPIILDSMMIGSASQPSSRFLSSMSPMMVLHFEAVRESFW